jgi:hypothetical protein
MTDIIGIRLDGLAVSLYFKFSGRPASADCMNAVGNIGIAANINGGSVGLGASGTFNLTSSLSGSSSSYLTVTNHTLATNGNAISVGYIQFSTASVFNFTNSTITLSATNGWYNLSGSPTLTSSGSTIILNNNTTFYGDGQTYNAVQFNGTGTSTIQGSNTFASIALGGGASQILKFTDGTTQTTGTLTTDALAKNLQGTSTAGWTITKSGGGAVNLDNLTISHSTATPASTWFDGYSSTVTTSTGWNSGTSTPSVSLSSPTNPAATSVTLNGSVSMGTETSLATEFEYGLTTSYGSTQAVTGSPITSSGSVTASLTGLTAGTIYHYRLTAVGNSTYHSTDGTFQTGVTPVSQSTDLSGNTFDGFILYNGYYYGSSRTDHYVYKINSNNYSDVTTCFDNSVLFGDAICEANGFIWAGTVEGSVVQINPATMTTVSTTQVLSGANYEIGAMTADSTNVYVVGSLDDGSADDGVGVLNLTTLAVNNANVTVAGAGTHSLLHELVISGNNLFTDNQGDYIIEINATTLAVENSAVESGGATSEEMVQDANYVYNITEDPSGNVNIQRWSKANLSETNCQITNAVAGSGLDSIIMLSDGSLLVGTNAVCTGGSTYLYRTTPSFTYSGTTYILSGITNTALQVNKIIQDGDYLDVLTIGHSGLHTPIDIIRYIMPYVTAPTIDNGSTGSIAASTASVSGTANAGNASIVTMGVQWGTATGVYGTTIDGTLNGTSYTVPLSGLPTHSTIYYRTFITTVEGTVNGTEETFSTLALASQFTGFTSIVLIVPLIVFVAMFFGSGIFLLSGFQHHDMKEIVASIIMIVILVISFSMFLSALAPLLTM